MIEPVSARTTTQLQEIYEQFSQHAERGPAAVSPGDQQRFEAALARTSDIQGSEAVARTEEIQVAQLQTSDPWVIAPPPGSVNPGPAVPTVGERILNGLTNLREGVDSMQIQMETMRNNTQMSPAAILDLQMQLNQTQLMLQLTTTEVSMVSQKIDGLLKTG